MGYLTTFSEPIAETMDIEDAKLFFLSDPKLTMLPVEMDGGVGGILTREICLKETNKRFFPLRLIHVGDVCDRNVLIFDAMQSVTSVSKKILETAYQGVFMIYHQGKFLGTSSVNSLLAHATRLQAMDLELAGKIQSRSMQVLPNLDTKLKIEWFNKMANEVGGDFIQYRKVNDLFNMLGVFDIAGKGVSAALSTSLIASFFETLHLAGISQQINATKIVEMLDRLMAQSLIEGSFLAGAFVFFNCRKAVAEIYNCGLGPIYVFESAHGKKKQPKRLDPKYPPLGRPDSIEAYIPDRIPLVPGMKVFVSTDGLAEMRNSLGHIFGAENLESFLFERNEESPLNLKLSLLELLETYTKATPLADDITFAVAEWKG